MIGHGSSGSCLVKLVMTGTTEELCGDMVVHKISKGKHWIISNWIIENGRNGQAKHK